MNENLDLTKILEGCPIGTEFYHLAYGKVWLTGIDLDDNEYPIRLSLHNDNYTNVTVTKEGLHLIGCSGECVLFPSKDQRDWSKFVRFWDKSKVEVEKFDPNTLQPFDKIIVRDGDYDVWTCALFSYFDGLNDDFRVITVGSLYRYCIPFNEETKHLIGTTDDCLEYYKWWEE